MDTLTVLLKDTSLEVCGKMWVNPRSSSWTGSPRFIFRSPWQVRTWVLFTLVVCQPLNSSGSLQSHATVFFCLQYLTHVPSGFSFPAFLVIRYQPFLYKRKTVFFPCNIIDAEMIAMPRCVRFLLKIFFWLVLGSLFSKWYFLFSIRLVFNPIPNVMVGEMARQAILMLYLNKITWTRDPSSYATRPVSCRYSSTRLSHGVVYNSLVECTVMNDIVHICSVLPSTNWWTTWQTHNLKNH